VFEQWFAFDNDRNFVPVELYALVWRKCCLDRSIVQLVIPVKKGIQNHSNSMDSRFSGNDMGRTSQFEFFSFVRSLKGGKVI